MVEWRKPDGSSTVGMLMSRPAFDDEFARWLVVPVGFGSVICHPILWPAVAEGEFWGVPAGTVSSDDARTLAQYFRRYLAEECGEVQRARR
ncbi:hypothetical protein [Streptomyces sp. AP-93]|uniref:hypothetical protein n=1 Tax=Streptomyces sp. AP-93 TaxID=2929048 RepID=UPI001FAF8827|nr:hypothetical protein [Streptomyces sp. AP-93]MCJ0868116.1 hypothetical protein [Streptomyces sp. AP-93]